MAIKKTIPTSFGITVDDAYIRVENVTFDDKNTLRFVARFYAQINGYQPFEERQFVCTHDLNGVNAYQQSYTYLKTLPEFTEAVDC